MGIFGPNKEEKLARAQIAQQQDAIELQYAAQQIPAKVSEEPQVSWRILDNTDYFLTYYWDKKSQSHIKAQRDIDLIEPCGSEPLAFLIKEKQDRELLNDTDATLTAIYNYMEKYGREKKAVHLFNTMARIRKSFLNNSRTDGKAGKLAKSQFVESTSQITRDFSSKKKRGGDLLGGLFG